MSREEALNKAIGILTYNQVNFCKSKEAVANMNEVIEALEKIDQEPCGDCVSREAVIDTLTKTSGIRGDALKALYDLPSVSPMPKWIPVSERLPSDGKYLVTRGDVIGRPMIGMRYFSKDLSKVDEFDFADKKGISGWCEYDSEYGWYIDDKVTAWMPLPEPYKTESEVK